MTVQDAETDPDNQLLDQALPAIARLEASLADEREAARLAVHSANLLDTLTNLGHAIAGESEQMDALDLISPRMWRAEAFHSRIIRWLLTHRPTTGKPGTSSLPCSTRQWLRHGC